MNEIRKHNQDICLSEDNNKVIYDREQISSLIRESKSDYILKLNAEGLILKANPAFNDLVGHKGRELIGESILRHVHEEDREYFIAHLKSLSLSPYSGQCENRVLTIYGWKWFFWSSEAIRDTKGRIVNISCIVRDVNSRKYAEKAFFEIDNKFRQIFDNVNNAIAVYEAIDEGTDFIIREFNQAAEQSTKVSKNKIFGERVSQVFPDIERFGLMKILQRVWKTGIPEHQPAKLYQDQRLRFWAENHVFKLRSGEVVAIFQDVTKYKEAEHKLRESEEFSRTLLERSPNPILVQNPDTSIVYVNPACESLTGYSASELIGQKAPYPYWPEEMKEVILKDMLNHLDQDRALSDEREFQKKSRERFWVEISASVVKDSGGKLKQIISNYLDITERRKVEKKNTQLASLVKSSGDAIYGTTLDGTITSWNKGAESIFGYTESEVIGKSISLLFPPGRSRIGWVKEKMLRGEHVNDIESIFLRKDGREIPSILTVSPVYDDQNRVVSISSIARDVTDLKKAENALKESERYNSSLLMNSPNPIVVMEPDFSIRYINKAFEEVTGFTSSEVLHQKPPLPWWKPEHHTLYYAQYQEAVGKGFSKQEKLIQKKNGEDLWIEVDLKPMIENGEVKYYLSMWLDKTEHKKAEEKLLQSEKKYSTLVEKGNDGVIIIQDGVAKFLNSTLTRMGGYSREEALGKPFIDFISPENRPLVFDRYRKRIAGEIIPDKYEVELLSKDGESISIEISASVIEYEGRPADMAIIRDITQRKKMQEQLMLTDRLASIGELAAGIAHELNNPLTSVVGFSQLILEGEVPPEIKDDLSAVNSEAQRAAKIVKNLLTFARKHSPVKQLNQINDCINEVLALRAYEHKSQNIKVIDRLDTDLPRVMFDYFQMQQVFINLITNAEFFMVQAHSGGTLIITTEKSAGIISISITDDGPGITQEDLKHLFSPFFTTKEVGKGTGLGLSICHGIISEHGGKIFARSETGKGATFIIELPFLNN